MNHLFLITLLATTIFLCRVAGFMLKFSHPSPFWEQFLRFVPISLFAALATSSFAKESTFISERLIALAAAGGVMWRTKHFGLAILVGLGVLWLLVGI